MHYLRLLFRSLAALALCATIFVAAPSRAEELTAVSGLPGRVVQVARVRHYAQNGVLVGLDIVESGDRPCQVDLYSDDPDRTGWDTELSTCHSIWAQKIPHPVKIGGLDPFITGIAVCLSRSNRVKGWTLYGQSFNSFGTTISAAYQRLNCPDDGWQAPVNCPAAMKAIGVQAHFAPGTSGKDGTLTGLALVCATR